MEIAPLIASFLACAVEMVEAATIVLAMEKSRGARSAGLGALSGLVTLVVVVAIFAPLISAVPLRPLRLVIGVVGLYIGIKWLKKSILRSAGRKAMHDEDAIYERELAAGQTSKRTGTIDRLGFIVSFKAVVLEGVEVVAIVLAVGGAQHQFGSAITGAVIALIAVLALALAVRKPLSQVPENKMKFAVGLMLTAFGTFWVGEGFHIDWPGGDVMLLALIAVYGVIAAVIVSLLRVKPEVSGR